MKTFLSRLLRFNRVIFSPHCLNHCSVTWFAVTMAGVVYHGVVTVIPAVYDGYGPWMFSFQHTLITVMFLEVMINWVLIRLIKSPFLSHKHKDIVSQHDLCSKGVPIYTENLRPAVGGNYDVMPTSNGASDDSGFQKDTFYMVGYRVPSKGSEPGYHVAYPYWSWKPCIVCQAPRPPRAFHCPICGICILKREHHCFFSGTCVGLHNQRNFIVFSLWAFVATLYSTIHATVYLFTIYIPMTSYYDVFLPFTVIRWMLSWTSTKDLFYIALYYSLVWFTFTSFGSFDEQYKCVQLGITEFEKDNAIKVKYTGSRDNKLRAVFGELWWMNFLIPLNLWTQPEDDGINWPNVKA